MSLLNLEGDKLKIKNLQILIGITLIIKNTFKNNNKKLNNKKYLICY